MTSELFRAMEWNLPQPAVHGATLTLLPIMQQQQASTRQLQLQLLQQQQKQQYALAQTGATKAALVEQALNILAYEAGLTEGTVATLRQAVWSGMERKALHALEKQTLDGFAAHAPGATTPQPQPPSVSVVLPRTLKPSSSKRQQLTVEQAAEIYSLRPRKLEGRGSRSVVHCRCGV